MSILGTIIGALTAPTSTTYLDGDVGVGETNNDFTGGLKNDKLVFDATVNLGEDFKDKNADFSKLDGGWGIDTLVIKLTESQHAALKAEFKEKVGAVKAGGLDLAELVTFFKVATGQQYVKFESIGVELKAWEIIKFEVVADPVPKPIAPTWTGPDFTASGKSIDLDLSGVGSLEFEEDAPRTNVSKGDDEAAYFANGNNVPVYDFTAAAYTGSAYSDRMTGNDQANTLNGGAGNDFLYGNAGFDTLSGQDGDDTIAGGEGNDILDGGEGLDSVYGDAGDDKIMLGGGNDWAFGGAGNDLIYGGAGNDTLHGNAGDDVWLAGEAGATPSTVTTATTSSTVVMTMTL